MPNYIRANAKGGTYFFTLATYQRRQILCDKPIRNALRQAIITVRQQYPFQIHAWVLLPDHLHCIWTLPENDADFSQRWSMIKRLSTQNCPAYHLAPNQLSPSKQSRHEKGIWQRRFYEHQIRDEQNFRQHMDYIHHNPVKHGWAASAKDWPYSSFHRYVTAGVYPLDWGGNTIENQSKPYGEP